MLENMLGGSLIMQNLMVLVLDKDIMSFLERHWASSPFNGEKIHREVSQEIKINERRVLLSSIIDTENNGKRTNIFFLEFLVPYSSGDLGLLTKFLKKSNDRGFAIGTNSQLTPFFPEEIQRSSRYQKISCMDGIRWGIVIKDEEKKHFFKGSVLEFGKKFIKEFASLLYHIEEESSPGGKLYPQNHKEIYRRPQRSLYR